MIQRNDKYDITTVERLLIRAGHHVWADRRKSLKSGNVSEQRAFDAALETIWAAKRAVRAELTAGRAEKSARLREYFEQRKAA